MTKIKFLLTICLLSMAVILTAQQEVGLHFMNNVWQSGSTNPAKVSENRLIINLPGIRNNLAITGATYDDIIFRKVDGRSQIDIDRVIENLEDQNLIRDDLTVETIGAAFKLGKITLSAGHAFKYLAYLDYPKTLPQVIWQGNAQFIGETVSLSNDLQLTGYNEYAVGAAMKWSNWTFGARVKYLSGIGNISTVSGNGEASLFTDPDVYQITLNSDYRLNAAGAFDYRNYNDFDLNFDFGKAATNILFTQNSGFALDLGVRFETRPFEFAAGVIDLGATIDWKEEVRNYKTKGSYAYDGLDFSQALTGESVNFQEALDTLQEIFQVTETSVSYSTKLPTKAYISAFMKLANMRVGGLVFTESYRGRNYPAFALGANMDVYKFFSVGATYAILPKFDKYANFGLNLSAKFGLVQVYGTTDNIVSVFRPGDSHVFSGRIGANLILK